MSFAAAVNQIGVCARFSMSASSISESFKPWQDWNSVQIGPV